jgi:hypothetical protein
MCVRVEIQQSVWSIEKPTQGADPVRRQSSQRRRKQKGFFRKSDKHNMGVCSLSMLRDGVFKKRHPSSSGIQDCVSLNTLS